MYVIRNEEANGIGMIPLLIAWKIARCNIKDCKNKPNTIIANTSAPVFGMCEEHYQEAVQAGKVKLELEFD